ncbi:MAG: neutral/alkaline non-lysosomal ceramidase N-terminal domain-containing protein [Candidatus Hydrogenedentes bacterium]|nr:neutral/alkaline non-lysosomal ceramidase N-terminal domain-containing protein [Candidatus Hydrogenedentota bacterium]
MFKKILKWAAIVLLLLVILFVTFVGPWPTYGSSDVTQEPYFKEVVAKIDENIKQSTIGAEVGGLEAGWSKQSIVPAIGTPLAGYGNREGKPSTGVHDEIFVRALALHEGDDTVVIVGSDMLIVPNNVADIARADAAAATPLTPNDILFNASHTHCGPGAWGPGFAGKAFSGDYSESVMTELGHSFGDAIIAAYKALEPAEIAHGTLDVPEFIRNRVRDNAPTDNQLKYLIARQADGDTCYLASYSAHPTVLGGSVMEFSADYPGYLYRYIESQTKQFSMYLGGAVGSMGPRSGGSGDGFDKAQNMGEELAKKILADVGNAKFTNRAEIASVGFPFETPSLQMTPMGRKWRVSPFLVPMLGIDNIAWVQGVRVGDMFFYGTPCDMSGEIAIEMKQWAKGKNVDLWVLSFCGDYIGYVSPQKYYWTADPNGDEQYEMFLMSWFGPNQEPFFTETMETMVEKMYAAL